MVGTRSNRPYMGAAIVFAALLGLADAAQAQGVESFYRARQVKLVIGSAPSDSYDLWGRLLARHMARHIPGNPTIVPENMPGGASIIAANHLFNLSPRDGTEFGTFSRNLPTLAVMNRTNVRYDPRRFGWIGSPETENRVCVAMSDAPVTSAAEMFTKELLMGGTGPGQVQSFLPVLYNNLLGTRLKVIDGYKGLTEIFLAMQRGELQGTCLTMSQLKGPQQQLLESGKIRLIVNAGRKPLAGFETVPSIYDFATTDEQRAVMDFVNSALELGRPFTAPPDLPPVRLAALRKAFAATVADAEFGAEAKRQNYDVLYTSGEAIQQLVERLYATPPAIIEKAAAMAPLN